MIVEIRGTKTDNKGAELMLRAITAELGNVAELAVEPRIGSYTERARMGLYQKMPTRFPRVQPMIERAIPRNIRQVLKKRFGIVFECDIDAVIDAWGFAYSDQFDDGRCEASAERAARWKLQGKKTVIVPQAFGPFTKSHIQTALAKLLDNNDLVFARERASFDHISANPGGRKDHVRISPDFTCLLHATKPSHFKSSNNLALIVPSSKLLTETSPEIRNQYLPFLKRNIEMLRARGLDVQLLVHERGDVNVVDRLNELLDEKAPVIGLTDALSLKGIIGAAQIVVGSRFHALVSALTQSVPALAVGWSHKYEMLLADYGCREFVVDPSFGDDVVDKYFEQMLNGKQRTELIEQLSATVTKEQERTREMWTIVRKELRLS